MELLSGRYPVRIAVVDLDKPPVWWHKQAADHITADEARAFAGTDGELIRIQHAACCTTESVTGSCVIIMLHV